MFTRNTSRKTRIGLSRKAGSISATIFLFLIPLMFQILPANGLGSVEPTTWTGKGEIMAPTPCFNSFHSSLKLSTAMPYFSTSRDFVLNVLGTVSTISPRCRIWQLALSIPPPPGPDMVWDPEKQQWVPEKKGINSPDTGKEPTNDKGPGRPVGNDEPVRNNR